MEQTLQERCLAEGRSDLLDQWHPEKNMDITPDLVSSCSHKRAWWLCEKGHVWQARINSRFHGVGCPICANKVVLIGYNDLGSTHPQISAQWHPVKNGDLTPQLVFAGSHRKVWWRCKSGHEWQASILSRTKGSNCPVCTNKKIIPGVNDLASAYPNLEKQWLIEKNVPLRADEVSVYSNRRVWWQCANGHVWKAIIYSRTGTRKSGCPVCAGKVRIRSNF